MAAIALATDRELVGAMTLYDLTPRAWSSDDLEAADALAALATGELVTM